VPTTNTTGEQVLEAAVSGPDGANRLFICTGIGNVKMSLGRNQEQITETWTFFVGPPLNRTQFHRAIGTASVSERVEVRVEVLLSSSLTAIKVDQLRYWVTILAQI